MTLAFLMSTAAKVSTLVAGLISAAIIMAAACYFETKKLKVTKVFAEKNVAEGPENTPLCRVGHLSDLHFPMVSVDLGDVIYKVVNADCDLVAVTGDLCQNAKGKQAMLNFMRRLAGKLGNVPLLVVLGNHDCSHVCGKDPVKIAEYVKEIENCGGNIRVLRDETVKIGIKGATGSIVAAGFEEICIGKAESHRKVFKEAAAQTGENDKLLLVMHNPDVMENIKEEVEGCGKYSMALAGHTHGGQVYMPFNFEFKVLRNDRMPRKGYIYGLFDYCKNNRLYINCGLGQSLLPIRLGTRPEIAFICF